MLLAHQYEIPPREAKVLPDAIRFITLKLPTDCNNKDSIFLSYAVMRFKSKS